MRPEIKQHRLQILHFRLERTDRQAAAFKVIENRFPWYRLAGLVAGLLVVYLAFQTLPFYAAWIVALLAFGGFMVIVVQHRHLIERIERLQAFRDLLSGHIARLRLDWAQIPPAEAFPDGTDHPFAVDLNITGNCSLHQLLDTCVSLGGSQRLAAWLLNLLPDPEQITRHQVLVRELLEQAGFRTRLELNGRLANPTAAGRWDAAGLLRWLEKRRSTASLRPVLIALAVLAAANISLFALNASGLLPPLWIGSFVLYFGLQSLRYRESSEVFDEALTLAHQMEQLRRVFADLEDARFPTGARLAEICAPFTNAPQRPSTALHKIGRIASAASLRNNPFLGLTLNILVPWDLFFAYRLERVKVELSGLLPAWLEAWYTLEALSALANFTALNPHTTFPEILPLSTQPVFEGTAVGHPLIPDDARVANDFNIRRLGEIVIITGSNMSGKSTFLRTVGVNLALAYAGSTVEAQSLRALPFRLFTSMTLNDSLNEGVSFFYAEVRRLKALLDQLDSPSDLPLFFLIDEIFRGTNNRERQIGSRAYTQALAGKNGVGLISTHDLELIHIAETIPGVQNFHFREEIQDGQMVFDYKIRPGSSPTTNALRIMALAGLPVPADGAAQMEKLP